MLERRSRTQRNCERSREGTGVFFNFFGSLVNNSIYMNMAGRVHSLIIEVICNNIRHVLDTFAEAPVAN